MQQLLLNLVTSDFEFSIWVNDTTLNSRQTVYDSTLNKRKVKDVLNAEDKALKQEYSILFFSQPLKINELKINEKITDIDISSVMSDIQLPSFLFFENVQYHFEWIFYQEVPLAEIVHKNESLNQCFRFIKADGVSPARITGTINTGNNIGWMRLPFKYEIGGQIFMNEFSFEVLPTKMDLHADLPVMYQDIDQAFPLWRFSLVEKTDQNASKSQNKGEFPLMWLANFAQLRERFEQGLKIIAQAPHNRLQTQDVFLKADRIKGRINHRTNEKIKEDRVNKNYNKYYKIETKKISVDTPENRFIKFVIITAKKKLTLFEKTLRKNNDALIEDDKSGKQRLSNYFLNEINEWQRSLHKIASQSFFNSVGEYKGLSKDSLVLQQKTGYSVVYRIWQDLKFYLDKFGRISNVSMKSVAEIYEIWCFLTIKNILKDDLGFEEIPSIKTKLVLNGFFEYQLKDGFYGAFKFRREDGIQARLVHEPIFTKQSKKIRSYLVTQEPDIVLEVKIPTGKTFIWIFDAKYRIKNKLSRFDNDDVNTFDYVPDDAINQMHRYRDALIKITSEMSVESDWSSKSRPIFGAFALYPGFFNQDEIMNPYDESIRETGIGAFALLPSVRSDERYGHKWLASFLCSQIGKLEPANTDTDAYSEKLYLEQFSRIPEFGMQQVLYPDLIAILSLNQKLVDSVDLKVRINRFNSDEFILHVGSIDHHDNLNLIKEIRYLTCIEESEGDENVRYINYIWPVNSVSYVGNNIFTEDERTPIDPKQLFCVFKLGNPLALSQKVDFTSFETMNKGVKFTRLEFLNSATTSHDIDFVYMHETWASIEG
ncbi:restriction endonuclease-like protein [Acinetobacter baumannii]|nr:restriction endonuclease-like protein [Acinetobacter baumannii]